MMRNPKAPSSSEEGVGGGGVSRKVMLERAARLRSNPTEPETRLWREIRASRLAGYKFRRQAVIGRRIADFFCPARGLIVEIDGDTHERSNDLRQDAAIEQRLGYTTLRFTNEEVMCNLDGVLARLAETLSALPERWGEEGATPPAAPLP